MMISGHKGRALSLLKIGAKKRKRDDISKPRKTYGLATHIPEDTSGRRNERNRSNDVSLEAMV